MSVIELGVEQRFPSVINVKRGPELRRYLPERTCRNVYEERVHASAQCDNGFMCSRCGGVVEDYEHYAITGEFNYCPDCGARVVAS